MLDVMYMWGKKKYSDTYVLIKIVGGVEMNGVKTKLVQKKSV